MKRLKKMGIICLIILAVPILMFIYGCMGGTYRSKLLNELQGEILYLKRDDDSILKIYQSKANLEDEELIYEHHSMINNNIINFEYDETTKMITFEAFDDDLQTWAIFELAEDGTITKLKDTSGKDSFYGSSYDPVYNNSGLGVLSENGDLFLQNQATNEKTLIKDFKGSYDGKFSPGYIASAISEDGKYVYYSYGKHLTPIGVILESLINPNYKFTTYVMNLETKETSRYVDFEQIIFLP